MGSSPQVSIVIPTRDRCALVQRAVRSALAQQDVTLEVIVVDDGSADDTLPTLHGLAEHDTRLRVLAFDASQGACAARNRGLEAARGEYYVGLDDDDELTPDHAAKLLAALRPEYAFVASSVLEVRRDRKVPNTLEAGVVTLSAMLHYNRIGPQVLIPLDRVRAVGGFDLELPALQDYDLWVRLLARYGSALRTRDCTYLLHVDHGRSRISTSSERRLRALDRFEQKHAALLTKAHRDSMALHRLKYTGAPLSLRDGLRRLHPDNAKMVASMWANNHLPSMQRVYHRFRSRLP